MGKIMKEPYMYFFILGFIVFGLHSFLGGTASASEDPFTVEVTSADIEWIRSSWETRMMRQPTGEELESLIDSYIRDEILYREALAMNLDEGDSTIKRRLVQRLTYVFEDIAENVDPTDDQLKEYIEKNKEEYILPETVSFTQVYFSSEKRDNALGDAENVLVKIKAEGISPEDAVSLGDPIMIDSSFHKKSPEGVAVTLGIQFSETLFSTEGEGWQGPISSTYGTHLVYISGRTESEMPKFEDIQEDVKIDFMYDLKKEIIDNTYIAMESRYTILKEGLPIE
jgi:hypothetical protein